jgi:hypothetical protein
VTPEEVKQGYGVGIVVVEVAAEQRLDVGVEQNEGFRLVAGAFFSSEQRDGLVSLEVDLLHILVRDRLEPRTGIAKFAGSFEILVLENSIVFEYLLSRLNVPQSNGSMEPVCVGYPGYPAPERCIALVLGGTGMRSVVDIAGIGNDVADHIAMEIVISVRFY